MEKPVAEPGAVVAGRIAGQAHDRVPQFGETFRQVLHVAGSLACAAPRGWEDHAGSMLPGTHIWSPRETRENVATHFPQYGSLDGSCRSGPCKAQRRKFPEARVACGNELSDARAGYSAVLYISGISSTCSRESLAKAKQTTTSSQRFHVP